MKFRPNYNADAYIYVKSEKDYLDKHFTLNIFDIKSFLINLLKRTLSSRTENVYKYNEQPLLEEDVYTDGEKLYNKNDLENITVLLNVLKEKPLYPIIDGAVINEPLSYKRLSGMVNQGMITKALDYEKISNKILADLIKAVVIEDNVDKSFITDDLGIKFKPRKYNPTEYNDEAGELPSHVITDIMEDNNNVQKSMHSIEDIILEEKYLLDVIEYSYHLADSLSEEIEGVNKNELSAGILDLSTMLSMRLSDLIDRTDINKYSIEAEIRDNILIVHKFAPYSSLRAKVAKYLLTKE